jgi:hypothetical protein
VGLGYSCITVPTGTKVYPIMATSYRSWVAKPVVLKRGVRDTSYPVPLDVVVKFPRFADLTEWHYIMFTYPVREKGKPKKARIVGFIYPRAKASK